MALTRSAAVLALTLLATPAFASVERAQAARVQGNLRAAQIELRNAVRSDPSDAALRIELAKASIELGDGDTAEKEIRAALERGYDRAAGTALLVRAYMASRRYQELLRGLPAPDASVPPAVAAEILSGRTLAYLALNRTEEARAAANEAKRIAPDAVATNLTLASIALSSNDRDGAEAYVDRVLVTDPANEDALLRKGMLRFDRGQLAEARDAFSRVIANSPSNLQARLSRAETLLHLGDNDGARADVDAALRNFPGSVQAIYLNAHLLFLAGDARRADEALQLISQQVPDIRDGYLLLAAVKRSLKQTELATDAIRRFTARRPQDPRGAALLADMEMEAGRPEGAVAALTRLVANNDTDADSFDRLGRAYMAVRQTKKAEEAFSRAVKLAPDNSDMQNHLAVARLANGDAKGMTSAAEDALRASPDARNSREMLAVAAVARGDLAAAEQELAKLSPATRAGETGQILEGTIRIIRLDLAGARAAYEAALKANPNSVQGQLGLARVAAAQGNTEEAARLIGEVLQQHPDNTEVASRLAILAVAGGEAAAPARTVMEKVQAASPNPDLTLLLATVYIRASAPARAADILEAELKRSPKQAAALSLRLAEARAAQDDWTKAEAASRAALTADAASSGARRQLAIILARRDDVPGAERLLEEGLRARPGDPVLQAALIAIAQIKSGSLESALAVADRIAKQPGAMPQAGPLRGDLLLAGKQQDEAIKAYTAAYQANPSSALALRRSSVLALAGKTADAAGVLDEWLAREPNDAVALSARSKFDMLAGRDADAERRLTKVVELAPSDAVALNNLAWLLQKKNDPASLDRAVRLAEQAYFIAPSAEIADTLGWIRVRTGNPAAGVPLLRQAARASGAGRAAADPAISYRLAEALRATGARDEAIQVLEPTLSGTAPFAERGAAERLLASLRTGR